MMDDTRVLLDDGDEIPLVPVKAPAVSSAAVTASPSAPKPLPAMDQLLTETKEEKKEIAAIEAASPDSPTFSAAIAVPLTLENAVDESIVASAVQLSDDDMRRRFRMLVSLYFRDLRDALETKSKFTMPSASGGMGMMESAASAAISIIEKKRKEYLAGESSRAAGAKAAYVAARAETHLVDAGARDQAESAARDLTHGKLMEASGLAAPGSLITPAPVAPPKVIPVVGLSSPKTVELIVPPAPMPAPVAAPAPAPTMPPPPEARFEPPANLPIDPATPVVIATPVIPAVPAPVAPPVAAPVAPPVAPPAAPAILAPRPAPMPTMMPPAASRPTMSDIQATPRLTGPVEELRAITLVDFRRLSKEPREATLKLKDKIDLLNDFGFEEKALGIKAWTESPVNKTYLDILRRSLEGRPVMDVIAEMDTKGEPTLLKAEFDAIMELNRRLRFG